MNTRICPQCHASIPAGAPGGLCPACVLRDADETPPIGRAAPSLAEISAAFPQLEVQRLIGQGGMGFVYQARQPSLDRTVALKILAPELGRDPAFAERFAREARVLGKLSHPNIVTVFEHGQAGGYFYLLMEYVEGVNLRQAMRAGRFTPPQALAVVPGICDALQAAHAQGVWHRDIKPENILLDARGGVKIADFGIARIVGDPARDFTLTATGGALGSAAYMAPEQHERPHDVDHRADIYSLGVVIYEMLTGELPLGRFPAPSERAAVSARIDEIVFQTLEKEREFRQQSAAEVKTDVTRAARAGDTNEPRRSSGRSNGNAMSIMALVGGIVLFGTAAVFTHGSTQGAMLAVAATLSALGALGLAFGKGSPRSRPQVIAGPPAKITVRSLGLFLGGLVACVVGVWIYNGGMISVITAGVKMIADDMGVPTRNRSVALDIGTLVIAAGLVSAAIGYGGMWYALWQMRRGFISLAWLRGLQTMVTAPIFCLAACAAIYAMRHSVVSAQREMQRALRAQQALVLAEKKARLEAEAKAPQPDRKIPTRVTKPISTPAAKPAVPATDIFREMNAFANESNGDEFRKHMSRVSFGPNPASPLVKFMQPFFGRVKMLKDLGEFDKWIGANKRSSVYELFAAKELFAALEQSDGTTNYLQFCFINEQGAWRYEGTSVPLYRASCRVEFRPGTGNAFNILRAHLGEIVARPVAGVEGQFDLSAVNVDPAEAVRRAEAIPEYLSTSLKNVGLDSALKIIAHPTLPTLPMHAEEASVAKPVPEPAKPAEAVVPVEEVFRKLSAFANESNGSEFKKLIAVASYYHSFSGPIAEAMEPFLGKITLLKPVPGPGKKSAALEEGSRTTLLAALEQSDGRARYQLFVFRLEQGAWRYEETDSPLYRASCRVEFRPESGDAHAILRTYLGENVATPVPGVDGQFDLVEESRDPGIAAAGANLFAERAASSLAKVGLDGTFKVIEKAAIPSRPIYAEDAPIEKPQP